MRLPSAARRTDARLGFIKRNLPAGQRTQVVGGRSGGGLTIPIGRESHRLVERQCRPPTERALGPSTSRAATDWLRGAQRPTAPQPMALKPTAPKPMALQPMALRQLPVPQ